MPAHGRGARECSSDGPGAERQPQNEGRLCPQAAGPAFSPKSIAKSFGTLWLQATETRLKHLELISNVNYLKKEFFKKPYPPSPVGYHIRVRFSLRKSPVGPVTFVLWFWHISMGLPGVSQHSSA